VNDEMERTLKEAVAAYCKVLLPDLPGLIEKITRNTVRRAGLQAKNRTRDLPNTEQRVGHSTTPSLMLNVVMALLDIIV
jgi:hypothetical protein